MQNRHFTAIIAAFLLLCAALVTTPPPAYAQGAAQTASVSGSVNDESGAPIAGATVKLNGPSSNTTASDESGAFSFSGLKPGIYTLNVSKPGYTTAVQNDITLLGGQSTTLAVRIGLQTFSSLRTIASVRTTGHALNTAAASVNVVTTQNFINQAQPQVTRVLNQVPGIQISFPNNSANGAEPGAITVPNIRGATSYETASLIDGHPISDGQYGDNVTTFLNTFMFGAIEVVKGPGADSPEVNNAIGGTTNFRTKDPTLKPYAQLLYGVDNRGGTISNFDFSDTVGRLGFVIDLATNNNPSPLSGKTVYYDPSGEFLPDGTPLDGATGRSQVGNTVSQLYNQPHLVACCYTLDGAFDQNAQLVKLRYALSNSTHVTVSYLGSQTTADQNGNTSAFTPSTFSPGAGYTGSVPAGSIMLANVYPNASNGEFNNEPIFQGEIGTTLGRDTLLARYYSASISRYQWGGQNPVTGIDFTTARLYGTSTGGSTPQVYNGQSVLMGSNDFYQEPELDKLHGESFEYEHPFGQNDLLTFSAEQTHSQSSDYTYNPCFCDNPNTGNTDYIPSYAFYSIPPGTHQELGTYLLRGHFFLGQKLEATLSNYFNTYSSTYATNCPLDIYGNCTQSSVTQGTGITFATTKNTHDDPRLGLVYRPSSNSSVRFSLGSAIVPPYLAQLSLITSPPSYANGVALESQNNGNLKPETAFGYDLGGDLRMANDPATVISGDVYMTNLFNRFFSQTLATGQTCAQVSCSNVPGSVTPASVPVLNQTNANIANARFEGVELTLQRTPTFGFGFDLSAALQKGYVYNLPPGFYCSVPVPGCTPDQNLNVIAGQNTNGVPVGFYSVSYNGNMRIPYGQGNAELNYTFPGGMYLSFGDTFYGSNNSLDRPAFGIAYATVRVPIAKRFALQLSGDNIFNAYPGILPVQGEGVPMTLYGGLSGATTANVLGPATWRLVFSTQMP